MYLRYLDLGVMSQRAFVSLFSYSSERPQTTSLLHFNPRTYLDSPRVDRLRSLLELNVADVIPLFAFLPSGYRPHDLRQHPQHRHYYREFTIHRRENRYEHFHQYDQTLDPPHPFKSHQ